MKSVKSIVAAMAICVPAVAAMAGSVSYTTPISGTTVLAPQLQQFNSALGTLTGVSVSLNIAITPITEVFNLSQAPQAFTESWTGTNLANAPTPVTAPGTDNPFTVTDPYDNSNTVSTEYSWNHGSGVANPGVNTFTDPNPISLTDLVSVVPGADFGAYIGTGSFGLSYDSTQSTSSQGSGGGLFFGSTFSLDGSATVTYTYETPANGPTVPVPASAVSGLVLMGAMAARKRLVG
jgi:hypothetical protein